MNASASAPAVMVRALVRPGTAQLASWGLAATALAVIQALVRRGERAGRSPERGPGRHLRGGVPGWRPIAAGLKSLILNG